MAMFDAAPDAPSNRALQQCAGFARAQRSVGAPVLTLPDGTLVLQRRRGPFNVHMLTRCNVTPARLHCLRNAGVKGPVILAPDAPLDPAGLPIVPLVSPVWLTTLDLTPSVDALRAGLHQKWRNRLKHAEKQGLRVTRQNMPDQSDHWVLMAEGAQQLARGYRSWPPLLTCAFARENPGDAKLFTAHLGNTAVAAMLVLRHGRSATYHIGHARPAGRMTSALNLLMWEAICWLRRKEVQQFELGLLDTEEGAGRARFKLGTGAQVRPLGGTWLWWPPLTRLARPLGWLDRRMMRAS